MRGILDANVFMSIVTPLSVYDSEAHVRISSDTFYSHATDASQVSWVDLELSSDAFESFDAENEKLALDVGRLERFGKLFPPDAPVTVDFDTSTQKVAVGAHQLQYEAPSLFPGSVPKVHNKQNPGDEVRATVSADTLFSVIDLAVDIADDLTFGIDDGERLYATASGEGDRMRMDFTAGPEIAASTDEFEVDYPLDKIHEICKVIPSGTELRFSFGDDSPLQLQYEFADGHGTVAFTVCPRYR